MPDSPRDRAAATFIILTVAACGMACLLAFLPVTGHDQMWLLYASRLWLHGAPLYGPEIFETNPPFILWLSSVPAALAGLTHLPDTALGKVFVLSLALLVAAICLRLYRLVRPQASRASLYVLAFTFVTVFAAMPARDFGQRDHLLILFVLPYVVAAAVRARSIPIPPVPACAIGALALCGFVLKPHQLLIPLAVEIALLVSRRRLTFLRPEIFAMLVSGTLFLGAVQLFAPAYFSVIVPLVRDTYWAYGHRTIPQLVTDSIQLHMLLLFVLALIAITSWRATSTLARFLFVAGVAATCAFYLQGTGWYYQQLPALTLLAFAAVVLLLDRVQPLRFPAWIPKAAAGLSVLALGLTAHFMDYPFTPERSFPLSTPDPGFFAALPPGAAVMTISPSVDDTIMPIYKFDLTLGERYSSFFMLPGLLRAEDPEGKHIPRRFAPGQLAELDRLQHVYMVEDLNRWKPALILVERCQDPVVHCQVLEDRHDDLLAFFLRDPAFAAIFSNYHFLRSSGPYDAYVPSR